MLSKSILATVWCSLILSSRTKLGAGYAARHAVLTKVRAESRTLWSLSECESMSLKHECRQRDSNSIHNTQCHHTVISLIAATSGYSPNILLTPSCTCPNVNPSSQLIHGSFNTAVRPT